MDNGNLRNKFAGFIEGRKFERKLSVLSGDINNGQILVFDETLTDEERVDAIVSSTSIPFAFPPVNIGEHTLVDGSIFTAVSIGDPIERCREEVEDDKDIIVDILLCYTKPQII